MYDTIGSSVADTCVKRIRHVLLRMVKYVYEFLHLGYTNRCGTKLLELLLTYFNAHL